MHQLPVRNTDDIAKAMGVEGVDNMTQEEYRKAAVDAVKQAVQGCWYSG